MSDQIRTCLCCGREAPRGELVRLVAAPGGSLVPDVAGKAGGRGLYVCPVRECISGLGGSGRFRKAAGQARLGSPAELSEAVGNAIEARLRSLLSIARKAGMLAIGVDCSMAEAGRAGFIAVASNAGSGAERLLESGAVRCAALDKARLGSFFGDGECAAFAVTGSGLAVSIREETARLDRMEAGRKGQ